MTGVQTCALPICFQPDSFVLITDEAIVRAMGLPLDDDTAPILDRQRGWLK